MSTLMQSSQTLFGLTIFDGTYQEALTELFAAAIAREGDCDVVVTPNVDHVCRLDKVPDFKALYATADGIYPDGMPVIWASKLLKKPLTERITGADLFPDLCRKLGEVGENIVVIGGMPGQEQHIINGLQQRYAGLVVDVFCPSMKFDPFGEEGQIALELVNNKQPAAVFTCLGMPKQENWAFHNRTQLKAGIVLCVGAALEFALGEKKRAPKIFQKTGFEWLWRMLSEPKRLVKRYLVDDIVFFPILWRELRKKS